MDGLPGDDDRLVSRTLRPGAVTVAIDGRVIELAWASGYGGNDQRTRAHSMSSPQLDARTASIEGSRTSLWNCLNLTRTRATPA